MSNEGIVEIHGKSYMTVAKRVELFMAENKECSIETEILPTTDNHVVIKATVKAKGRVTTGISSVALSSSKSIEKSNPYEVAETSAVGRALGFAGYGIMEGIASADEMVKATAQAPIRHEEESLQDTDEVTPKCAEHGVPMKKREASNGGTWYDHRRKNEETDQWEKCNGTGWKA